MGLIAGLLTLMIVVLILLSVLYGPNFIFPGLGLVIHAAVLIVPLIALNVLILLTAFILRKLHKRKPS